MSELIALLCAAIASVLHVAQGAFYFIAHRTAKAAARGEFILMIAQQQPAG